MPLAQQDARLWSRDMIIEAEGLLTAASRAGVFGRFQCEAAIQSVHAQRPISGRTQHDALAALYRLLVTHCPSVGARVAQAAALLDAGRADEALSALAAVDANDIDRYQPYWVTRSRALTAVGRHDEAAAALATAVGLTTDPAVRSHLQSDRPVR